MVGYRLVGYRLVGHRLVGNGVVRDGLVGHWLVRHRLVSDIVDAYARWDAAQEAAVPASLPGNRAAHGRTGRRR